MGETMHGQLENAWSTKYRTDLFRCFQPRYNGSSVSVQDRQSSQAGEVNS